LYHKDVQCATKQNPAKGKRKEGISYLS